MMSYTDPVNPDWEDEIVAFKASEKAAGLRYTKEQLDGFDALAKTLKEVSRTKVKVITLSGSASQVDTGLDGYTPIFCTIDKIEKDFDFTDPEVYSDGILVLDDTYPPGTKIKLLYN